MKSFLAGAILVLGVSTPVHAQSQAERLDGFAAIIADNDCQALRAESETLFGGAGFTDPVEIQHMIFALILSGRAMTDGEAIRLFDGTCAQEGFDVPQDVEMLDAYIKALEENGCELTVAEARAVLGEAGIDNPNVAAQFAAFLRAEGQLVVLHDPFRLRVVSGACPAG